MRCLFVVSSLTLLLTACGGDDDGAGHADAAASSDGGDEVDATPEATEVELIGFRGGVQADLDWVAVQVDGGAFEHMEGASGVYRFEATASWAAIWHCGDGAASFLGGMWSTPAEATTFNMGCFDEDPAGDTFPVSGTLSNAGANFKQLKLDDRTDFVAEADTGYSLTGVPEGHGDLVVVTSADGADLASDGAIVHDVVVNSAEDVDVDLDLDGAPMVELSIDAPGADSTRAALRTTLGTEMLTFDTLDAYTAFPASLLTGNDVMIVSATATDGADRLEAAAYFQAAENVDLELPDPWTSPVASTDATEPYVRLRVDFDQRAGAEGYGYQATSDTSGTLMFVTADALGDADWIAFPDLSDVEGWDNGWAPAEGVEVDWIAAAYEIENARMMDLVRLWPRTTPLPVWDGMRTQTANRSGTFIP
jgi:hypothetical protein